MSARGWLTGAAAAIVAALGIFLLRETRRAPGASDSAQTPAAASLPAAASSPVAAPPPSVVAPPPSRVAAPPVAALPPVAAPAAAPATAASPDPFVEPPPQLPQVEHQIKARTHLMVSMEISALESELRRAEQTGDAERARDLEQRLGELRHRKRLLDEELGESSR